MIRLRRSLKVAQGIHRILEDKRDILVRRLNELVEEAEEARRRLMGPLSGAFGALHDAMLTVSPLVLQRVAESVPVSLSVRPRTRTIIGINVPVVEVEEKKLGLTYGFADTSVTLDVVAGLFREFIGPVCKAAELENAIFRLAEELKKTQRLLNALEHVIIPRYRDAIKFISMTLEERERDDFVKLKHLKRRLERREEMERAG